jgi:DNA gyrase/topoisomerase IV subunit A
MTRQGYFKKLSAQTSRSEEQKLKDGDEIFSVADASNADSVVFVTDRAQLYTVRLADLDASRPSMLGDYLCAKLSMEKSEKPVAYTILKAETTDTDAVVAFADGSAVKYSLEDVRAQPKRMKLLPAIKLPPAPVSIAIVCDAEDDLIFTTSEERYATISASLIERSSAKRLCITEMLQLKRGVRLLSALREPPEGIVDPELYRRRTLPALAISKKH